MPNLHYPEQHRPKPECALFKMSINLRGIDSHYALLGTWMTLILFHHVVLAGKSKRDNRVQGNNAGLSVRILVQSLYKMLFGSKRGLHDFHVTP
jgi:hypothetical protein